MSQRIDGKPVLLVSAWIGALVVVLLTLWAYGPALDAPFVFDDEHNIVDSPAIRWTEFSWENVSSVIDSSRLQTRPVANFSFAVDHLYGGLEPRGFHLTNVLIHLAVGGALMWLCLLYVRVAQGPSGPPGSTRLNALLALLPVGLFLLHPLNTQAVTYVVQRMTSLSALFTLLAFTSYLMARYRVTRRANFWYGGVLIFWALAVGSKEIGVLLLPIILLYEICFFRSDWQRKLEVAFGGRWNRQWTIRAWFWAALVGVFACFVVVASSDSIGLFGDFQGRNFSGLERIMTQARVQVFHLSQVIWPLPSRLNLDHDFAVSRGLLEPATTLPAILACVALLAGAIYLAVRQPRYGFPLVAYAIFHSIEAGPVNLEIIFEHRMYLPSSMLVLVGAALLVDARPLGRVLAVPTIAVLAVVLTGWTYARNQVWADPMEFQRDIALKSPNKARAHHNFALALLDAGRSEEALPVIRQAIKLDASEDKLSRLLGDIYLDLGQPADAVTAYQTAINLEPINVKSILGLSAALEASGKEEAAFQYLVETGTKLGRGGYPWEAIPVLAKAVEVRTGSANARNALGSAYMAAGLQARAIEHFRAALEFDPTKFEAWYNLGLAADAIGSRDEAIGAYRGFLERAPPNLQQPITRARTRIQALSSNTDR